MVLGWCKFCNYSFRWKFHLYMHIMYTCIYCIWTPSFNATVSGTVKSPHAPGTQWVKTKECLRFVQQSLYKHKYKSQILQTCREDPAFTWTVSNIRIFPCVSMLLHSSLCVVIILISPLTTICSLAIQCTFQMNHTTGSQYCFLPQCNGKLDYHLQFNE